MAQVYGDALYNADGYWLLAEEFLEANSVVVSSSTAAIYLSMDLAANSVVVSSSSGDLAIVQPVILSLTGLPLSITNIPITATVFMFGSSPFRMYPFGYVVGSDQLEPNITKAITASPVMNTSIGVILQSSENLLTGLAIANDAGYIIPYTDSTLLSNAITSSIGIVTNNTAPPLTAVITNTSTGSIYSNIDKGITGSIATSTIGSINKSSSVTALGVTSTLVTGTPVSNLSKGISGVTSTAAIGSISSINARQISPVTITASNNYINSSRSLSLYANSTLLSAGTILFGYILPHRLGLILDKEYKMLATLDKQ